MKKFELSLRAVQVPLDIIALFAAGFTAYALRFTEFAVDVRPVMFSLTTHEFTKILLILVPSWIAIFAANGLYVMDPNRKFASELSRVFFSCTVGLAAITVFIFFRGEFFNSRFIVLAGWLIACIYVAGAHLFLRLIKLLLYSRGVGVRRVALIGSGPVANRLAEIFDAQKFLGFRVVARYSVFNETVRHEILERAAGNGVDELILTDPKASREETLTVLSFAEAHHFTFQYSADLFSTLARNMRVATVADIPLIEFRRARLDGWGKILKRVCDVSGALLCTILMAPLMAAAAVAIYKETGKPLLFKNTRVGYRGRRFKTFKFRSMFQKDCTEGEHHLANEALDAEKNLIALQNTKRGPVYKIGDDPRVTPVGKFLRRWSIDELPQMWNVLCGDMSLVGPRPHQPREVAQYSPEDRRVHAIKPGITGLAQISGRSDLAFEDEIKLDMLYLENWSLMMDVFILLKTPWAVVKRRRAE